MKKTILTISCLIAGTLGVFAQGALVFFNNYNSSYDNSIAFDPINGLDYRIYNADKVTLINDATWSAQLWELPASGQPTPIGAPALFRTSSTPGSTRPGTWNSPGDIGPLSVAPKVETTLEVRIYDGTGTEVGRSPEPFKYTMLVSDPVSPTDTQMRNFRGFAVPEPSTVALGVLGLGALLLFRRRK